MSHDVRDLRARRARKGRQRREGIVMLIVMLMLLMATGTAMFTIQATQYEQRASTSLAEANWARSVAESATMGAIGYAENTAPTVVTQNGLGGNWSDGTLGAKFGLPTPNTAGDAVSSMSYDVPPFVANMPGARGLGEFLPGERCPLPCAYVTRLRRDGQGNDPTFAPNAALAGLTYVRPHWLMETITVPTTGQQRIRHVVTGFGEVHVWGDQARSARERERHEVDAVSRGYIDRISPVPN